MSTGLQTIFCDGFEISNGYSKLGGSFTCANDGNEEGNPKEPEIPEEPENPEIPEEPENPEEPEIPVVPENIRGQCSVSGSYDITGAEENTNYAFANISKTSQPIWVTLDKKTNTIIDSKGARKDLKTKQDIGTAGNGINSTDLEIPCSINGTEINKVNDYAFQNAKFSGDIVIASNVHTIGNYAVHKANFKGGFYASGVKTIGMSAFQNSYLVGDFYAPNVDEIVQSAFYRSNFKKDFSIKKGAKLGVNNGNIIARSKEQK